MPLTDWQLTSPGATFAARLAAATADTPVAVPNANAVTQTLKTQEFTAVASGADHHLWPLWAVARVAGALYTKRGLTGYCTDVLVLPTQIGATLDDANATGFCDGTTYATVALLARALGRHAQAQRALGNVAPYELDDTGAHDFQGHLSLQGTLLLS